MLRTCCLADAGFGGVDEDGRGVGLLFEFDDESLFILLTVNILLARGGSGTHLGVSEDLAAVQAESRVSLTLPHRKGRAHLMMCEAMVSTDSREKYCASHRSGLRRAELGDAPGRRCCLVLSAIIRVERDETNPSEVKNHATSLWTRDSGKKPLSLTTFSTYVTRRERAERV